MDFKCQGCGACCRIKNGIVRVGDDEIRRIAEFLAMSEQAFIDQETELAPDRRGLILKSRPDESCVYLTDDNRCRIHPVKPDKCRTFPFAWPASCLARSAVRLVRSRMASSRRARTV